jgi:ribosomal protein S18 acetylase RimI-like enzyme
MIANRSGGGFTISGVRTEDREKALRILFARFPPDEQGSRLEATLRAVAAGTLRLEGLRWAVQDGLPVGAALAMEQPDGIALVWPPTMTCAAEDAQAVEDALLADLAQWLDATPARMAQILLDPDEISDASIYERHGFRHRTELFFVARSLHEPLPDWHLGELSAEAFDASRNADRFAAAIEASYRGSLDCQWLEGVRSGREALASHQLSGTWEPALWHLYVVDGCDVGLLLLNDHPDQDAMELVYFGVDPSARGRGYGRALVGHALTQALARGRSLLFAAVDAANTYANAIYAEAKFVELARRQALFRFPGGLARE